MGVLTVHGYSRASDEVSITDGSETPVNTYNSPSLHPSLLSLEDSSRNSSSDDEFLLPKDTSLEQSGQHCENFECIDGVSRGGAPVHRSRTFLNKDFMIPIRLGLALEGNILGEYFGLAMAVCAVGLLRSACFRSETANTTLSKEATLSMVGKHAPDPLELVMQRSEKKQGREIQEVSDTVEQSTLLQKINQLQGELFEVRRLRSEDGKANERVVSIFASKEQAWKAERRKFRDDQQMLCQELQRAYLQQEGLSLKLEQLRSLQKQPCSECEHRESVFAELKEHSGEQVLLIIATMEEFQIERQEKNVLAENLACAESSLSQLQEKLVVEVERHTLELRKHEELLEQLQIKLNEAETRLSQVSEELGATQACISTLIHEKACCEEHIANMSIDVTQLKRSVHGKDDIISAMLKKAKADNEDRKELERELGIMKTKLCHTAMEKEKLRRHFEINSRSFSKTENFRFRNSFGSRSVPNTTDIVEEMQKLHDVEIRNLHSIFEEQVQMLQKRLSLYQERVTDLEEDILLCLKTHKEHDSLNCGEIMDNNCMVIFKESMEAELATKQFQLSVAKTLIKQFIESEAHREQEIENWKKLYLACKAAIGIHTEKEQAGAIVPKNPKSPDLLELEKSRYTLKLEQRHWELIDAFERQMRARDERMEAFRWQLLRMEEEVQRSHRQIEGLKKSLECCNEENMRLEELVKHEREKVLDPQNKALGRYTKCDCHKDHDGELCSLQDKVSALQALLTENEREYEQSLIRASAEAEFEQRSRECKLDISKAQLVQARAIFDKEREEKEERLLELQKEQSAIEHYFNNNLNSGTKQDLPAVPHKASLDVRSCFLRLHIAQAQASPGNGLEEEHVKELVEQSAQYFNSIPEGDLMLEEPRYVSGESGKTYVLGKAEKPTDDALTVDKFVAEVQPHIVV